MPREELGQSVKVIYERSGSGGTFESGLFSLAMVRVVVVPDGKHVAICLLLLLLPSKN